MALARLFWLWLLVAGTQGENDGDMRLADGDAANQGRVEIFYQGQWGTVCDNLWDLLDASVVCRALGFKNATEALGRAAFGPGTGPVMLDEVPLWLLAQHRALNLTEDAYRPRLYTSATWSSPLEESSRDTNSYDYYPSYKYGYYTPYPRNQYQSFETPAHPSFLFQARRVSWSLFYLPTVQSCGNYGFSCSSDEVPVLGLSNSGYSNPTIGYENKALMLCGGRFVADVADFWGGKATVPSALDSKSSRRTSFFPCPEGPFSKFRVVIRPFYLTNSSSLD
ncbi:galectin 3 binding protein [Phyllostomus discolor]|uniref:Soluble scavenger receptor cysteine-rich domain-containing protein SSC5D n=1 Tax=Phyllostomus discolor TaxID=89673 RepID=A0A834DVU3_9CHIR|nr:galectin 3 binding protein [Phyllostomus discolor]